MRGILVLSVLVSLAALVSSADPPSKCVNATIKDCETCMKADVSCLWCNKGHMCMDYPVSHVIPQKSDCPLGDARWGVCWLNFEALIISCSIIGFFLLLGITLCFCKCCGCCCFKKNRSAYAREEARLEAERQSRKMRQDERRKERKARNDEIRRKYGLTPSEPQYQKFENE